MQIGIDASRALRRKRTGTERYAWEIIHNLLALPGAERHRWRLYGDVALAVNPFLEPAHSNPCDCQKPDFELCLLPARRLWTHRTLARELRQRPPDVLFIPSHVIPFAWQPERLPNSVVTIHDLGYHYFPDAHTRFQRLYLRWSTGWSARVAKQVIAVSQATARDLQRFYDIPAAKIRVIHEAVTPPPHPAAADVAAVRARYGVQRPYALYVGTIQPRKNLARLIRAYAQLRQRQTLDWDLVLAGNPGWLSCNLLALAGKLGLADRIHFPGYVPESDLPALLAGAHFFCYPSLFEGFGLPVLEAQSIGVPVMTANSSALPEIAGDAALLVDPTDVDAIADAMLRLSQDEALRQRLIEAGYANVRRFSWPEAARATLAVLEAAWDGKRKR
jgi:glycosyltransferase involved in cell wall biosynthesis